MFNEHTIRILIVTGTLIGVPVLLLFALRKWIISGRRELPHWRNGLGMTALLFAVSGWLWCFLLLKGIDPNRHSLGLGLWSFETSVGVLFAPVLSLAWKRAPRYYLISSTVILILGARAFYYV